MKRMPLKQKKGFTLLEILMVIVIMGVLASIMVPKFAAQLKGSKISASVTQLENLRAGINIYNSRMGHYPLSDTDLRSGLTSIIPGYFDSPIFSRFPKDPVEDSDAISGITATPDCTNCGATGGWCYYPDTGEVGLALQDYDDNGLQLCEY